MCIFLYAYMYICKYSVLEALAFEGLRMLSQNCRQVAAPCVESTKFILLTFFEIPSTAQVFCRIFSTKTHAEVGGCQLKSLGLFRRSACMAHTIHPLPYAH